MAFPKGNDVAAEGSKTGWEDFVDSPSSPRVNGRGFIAIGGGPPV